jgi:hypothetical protein
MRTAVVELAEFIRKAKAVLSDDEREALIDVLSQTPDAGISLGGGVRKLRFARTGGGKSGGYRVIYYYAAKVDGPVFLITVFAKNEKSNLTAAETAEIAAFARGLAKDHGRRQ